MSDRPLASAALLPLFLLVAGGCSDSTSGPDGDSGSVGQATFELSGAISGERSGFAQFGGIEVSGLHMWSITVSDGGSATFSLTISISSADPFDTPAPGTYPIGMPTLDPSIFSADYADTREGLIAPPHYTTIPAGTQGSITITQSTEGEVSGTFHFNAVHVDSSTNEALGEIVATNGAFTATPR